MAIYTARTALKFSYGNCGERALVAGYFLKMNNMACELFQLVGHHVFMVVNRDPNSNASDPKTWGKDAMVVDFLIEESFPPNQIKEKILDKYVKDGNAAEFKIWMALTPSPVEKYFYRFPPSEKSFWKNKDITHITIETLTRHACEAGNSCCFFRSETGTLQHLMALGIEKMKLFDSSMSMQEKAQLVTEAINETIVRKANTGSSKTAGYAT